MKTVIVDYGMGNLHSVLKSVNTAAERAGVGTEVLLSSRPEDVRQADKIIFPGQGAMPDCMAALQRSGLREAVEEGLRNKPFFGVCVGAQLLFEHSEEGDTAGLGWFKGAVKRFAPNQSDAQGNRLKVPHMGWNTVRQTQTHALFAEIANPAYFYFVHSYYFAPADENIVLGVCPYPDEFACIVGKDNVFATQFHTEISHDAGVKLFENFLRWDV